MSPTTGRPTPLPDPHAESAAAAPVLDHPLHQEDLTMERLVRPTLTPPTPVWLGKPAVTPPARLSQAEALAWMDGVTTAHPHLERLQREKEQLQAELATLAQAHQQSLYATEWEQHEREKVLRALNLAKRALRALSECTTATVQALDEQSFLETVCRIVVETGGYRLAWVGLAREDAGRTVDPVAQYGYEDGYLDTLHITWANQERGRGPTGTAIRTGAPALVRDIQQNPRFKPWREQAARRGYASLIGLPLRVADKVVGALTLYAALPNAFDLDEVGFLLDLARTVSFGMTSLRSQATRRALEDYDLRAFQTRITISALLETALEPLTLTRQLEVALDIVLAVPWLAVKSKGSIFLHDPHSGYLTMAVQRGLHQHLLNRCARIANGYCLCGRAAQTSEIVFAGSLDHRHDVVYEGITPHGHYCVPILHQRKLMGVLNLYLAPGHQRNPEEEALLTAIANTLAGIIKQRSVETELERERLFTAAVLNTAAALVVVIAPDGSIVRVNRFCLETLGMRESQIRGRQFADLFTVEGDQANLKGAAEGYPSDFESVLLSHRGNEHHIAWSNTALLNGNAQVEYLICTGVDITERKRAEAHIRHLAHHDTLTGLPNRVLFHEQLEQALALNRRHRGLLAVLFLDLDRFKQVNDTLGHEVGDHLLKEAAQRIQGLLREADMVARMGGDEFIIILPEITHPEDALLVAKKVNEALNLPFRLGKQVCRVGASIGIALHPSHGEGNEELMRKADLALYAVKGNGRNHCRMFEPSFEALPPGAP